MTSVSGLQSSFVECKYFLLEFSFEVGSVPDLVTFLLTATSIAQV